MRYLLVVPFLIIALTPRAGRAVDWIEFDGYVKSFVVGIHPAEIENLDESEQQGFLWANNNRLRSNLAFFLSDWLDFDASYDLSLRFQDHDFLAANPFVVFQALSIYRVTDLNRTIWPDEPAAGDQVLLLQNLDRLFFTVRAPQFDLFVGRQAIAWGSAKAINPTDIIAPFLYTEIDVEDRIGVDAARLRMPAGSLGEVDLGYVAGDDFKWSESAAFARVKFYAAKTDVAMIAMVFRENGLAGLDVTRAVGGAGAWCEAAYVWAGPLDARTDSIGDHDYLRLSAGADYNFATGVYTMCEYHFNGAGQSDPHHYLTNVAANTTAYQDGAVYLLGRHYLIPGVTWQSSPLTTLSLQVMANLGDGSFLFAPYFEYNVTDNLYLSLGGYAAVGDNPESVNGLAATTILNSEFGAYPGQYYAFLRYYF
jgi:hypothetical protein